MAVANKSKTKLKGTSNRRDYRTEIGYLKYDGNSNLLSVPIEVRERHFDEDTKDAEIQAFGESIFITVESERDTIRIEIPIDQWSFVEPFSARFKGRNNGLLPIGRIDDLLETHSDSIESKVVVMEHKERQFYRDSDKITFDEAKELVDGYIRRYGKRRTRVSSRDIAKKEDIKTSQHNLHRLNSVLDDQLETDRRRSSKTTMYKI